MKTFLMIGMGNFGHLLAREFVKQQCELMVVDCREEALEDLLTLGVSAKIGDCTNPEVLSSFDVPSFDACFVSVGGNFQTSLEIVSLLKELGAAKIYCKAENDVQEKFLRLIGAHHIIYPERQAARSLAISESNDSIFDCIPMSGDYSVYEVATPAAWLGKSLRQVNVRSVYSLNILAIVRDGTSDMMPSPDYIFNARDHLMVLGTPVNIARMIR